MSFVAKCLQSSERKLQEIPLEEWCTLRDLYAKKWPLHILSYNTLQNYIEWAAKNPSDVCNVRISSVDACWRQHGTYILEDRSLPHCNVLFNTLAPPEQIKSLVLKALQCLEHEPAYTLTAFVEQVRSAAEAHLHDLNITKFADECCCQTLLYHLPKEQCLRLKIRAAPGFVFKPLTEENVTQIDRHQPQRYSGFEDYIRRVIQNNLSFGAFRHSTGELCAWVMQQLVGTIGLLQEEDAYKRRGLREQLLRLMAIKMGAQGIDATATVLEENNLTRHMFQKLGFKVIDRVYWYDKLAGSACCQKLHQYEANATTASLRHD